MTTTPERPRHARKEIRDFADWMADRGWVYIGQDASGHTIWSHPKASSDYKLPETPKVFNVKGARAQILRLEGATVPGKRSGKAVRERAAERRAAEKRAEEAARVAEERRAAIVAEAEARVAAERERREELAELEEACQHAGRALRNDPSNPRLRAHLERLRAQYRTLHDAGSTA